MRSGCSIADQSTLDRHAVVTMIRDRFWELIEQSLERFDPSLRDGNMAHQAEDLGRLLSTLPAAEIVGFNEHFWTLMADAYRWDMWAAAYIAASCCSDDSFSSLRNGLLSRGRGVDEGVCRDAESLADHAYAAGVEDIFFEELSYAIQEAYEGVTGEELLDCTVREREVPAGERWTDDEDLE